MKQTDLRYKTGYFTKIRNLSGVLYVKEKANQYEILTNEKIDTIVALDEYGVAVELEQNLRFSEILQLLLDEREGVEMV